MMQIYKKINIRKLFFKRFENLRENYLMKLKDWHDELEKVRKLKECNLMLSQLTSHQRKTIETLETTIESLHNQIQGLEAKVGNPAEVVKKMLGRPLKWKDVNKMTDAEKREYGLAAKQALENETLMSEINRLTVDLINDIAKETSDFQQVLNRRFTLNGVQLIKERLESVPQLKEEEPDTEDELNEAI